MYHASSRNGGAGSDSQIDLTVEPFSQEHRLGPLVLRPPYRQPQLTGGSPAKGAKGHIRLVVTFSWLKSPGGVS